MKTHSWFRYWYHHTSMYFSSVIHFFFFYSNFHCLQGFRMKKSSVLKPAPVRPAKVYQMSKHSKTFVLKSGNKTFRNLLLPAFDQSPQQLSVLDMSLLFCQLQWRSPPFPCKISFAFTCTRDTHETLHVVQCLIVTAKPNMSYRC